MKCIKFLLLMLWHSIVACSQNSGFDENNSDTVMQWRIYLKDIVVAKKVGNTKQYYYPYKNLSPKNANEWKAFIPHQALCLQHNPYSVLSKSQHNSCEPLELLIQQGLPLHTDSKSVLEKIESVSDIGQLLYIQGLLITNQASLDSKKTQPNNDDDWLDIEDDSNSIHTVHKLVEIINNKIIPLQQKIAYLKEEEEEETQTRNNPEKFEIINEQEVPKSKAKIALESDLVQSRKSVADKKTMQFDNTNNQDLDLFGNPNTEENQEDIKKSNSYQDAAHNQSQSLQGKFLATLYSLRQQTKNLKTSVQQEATAWTQAFSSYFGAVDTASEQIDFGTNFVDATTNKS